MPTGGLSRWFNENWVDLSRPKKGGGYEPCGRTDASEGKYPKCVPASRAARMTPEEIKSAIQRKRRAESTQTREDKKPIMVATVKKHAKHNQKDHGKHKTISVSSLKIIPKEDAERLEKFGVGIVVNPAQKELPHYDSESKTINVQNTNNKATMLHELGHAMDHSLGWISQSGPYSALMKQTGASKRFSNLTASDVSVTRSPYGVWKPRNAEVYAEAYQKAIDNSVGSFYEMPQDLLTVAVQARTPFPPPGVAKSESKNIPADMELYNRVKAEAKRKFDVYPSAYANGWLVQEYKRRGGKYKTVEKVARMTEELWFSGESGFIAPHLGNANALGKGMKRADYGDFINARRRVVKNYKGLKANSYQRERFQKENESGGRSGGELGRGNNQVRARRRLRILKEWGNGKTAPCVYCGAKLNYQSMELEKLYPEIGYDTFENLAPACRGCNASMGNNDFAEKIRMISKSSPDVSDVHVATIMNPRKRRDLRKKKMAMDMALRKAQPLKDPKGGLTAAGRKHFKQKEGANLKPGVRGAADTPEKMRRKGSFLTRFFTNPSGPMVNDKGEPTRLALSAAAWGEPVPKNRSDAAKLASKGRRLLERYENVKKHGSHDQSTHGKRGSRGADYSSIPSAGKTKTQAQKNKEVDALTESQYQRYLRAPKKMSHDEAIAYATTSPTKGKPRPKAPTKASEPQLKTRLTPLNASQQKKAAEVKKYMNDFAKKLKDPATRKYCEARIKQMTSGEARPSGMSKSYGIDKATVIRMEGMMSRIFRAGREKVGI